MTIITRIQSSASSSNSIVDSISTNTLSATATLIDALGDKGWQVTAGGSAALAAPFTSVVTGVDASQIVFVLRGIVNSPRPADFTPLGAITMADLVLGNGIHFDTAGSTAGRARYFALMTATAPANSLVTSDEFCIVYRVDMGDAGDYGYIWYKRTDRPDSTPDNTSVASTADVRTFTSVAVAAGITLTDLICIVDEGYTDTQCAVLADDLRAVFPADGGAPSEITGDAAITLDGDTVSADGTVSGGSSAAFTVGPLRDNFRNLRANQTGVTVDIYNATTRELIVRETGLTTNASGMMTVSSASMVAATAYRFNVVFADGVECLPVATAA